jgi:1-acyl-sn-glycerol-3-phosphate acyltransferase
MAHLVTASLAYSFVPDRRYSWWNRLIGSLARLGRAIAAERSRRRAMRRLRGFDGRWLADRLKRISREIHRRLNIGGLVVRDQR